MKIHNQNESYLLFKVHRPTARQSGDVDSKIPSTKIDKVQENPRDVNQQPIRYLVVPFVCPNKLCN